jgi:hypothetical protein
MSDEYELTAFDVSATKYEVRCKELEFCNVTLLKGQTFWLVQKDYLTPDTFIVYTENVASYMMGGVDQMWIDCALEAKTIKRLKEIHNDRPSV